MEVEGLRFFGIVRRLQKADKPMLTCGRDAHASGHASVPCMASLSIDHLAALAAFCGREVVLNMSACERCENRLALSRVEQDVTVIRAAFAAAGRSQVLSIATDESVAATVDVSLDRRAFFSHLGESFRAAVGTALTPRADDATRGAMWTRELPLRTTVRNEALNALVRAGQVELAEELAKVLNHRLSVDGTCDLCFACVGSCPNAALAAQEDDSPESGYCAELRFREAACSGCGLCEEFCLSGSIRRVQGGSVDTEHWTSLHSMCDDAETVGVCET
jgi:Pyruvate/2-oxoacid:ferredoxin oxidoreductase delta subunit